ncbi:MAG: zinc-ribbon domain-containing protein [Haloquadratum sp.]
MSQKTVSPDALVSDLESVDADVPEGTTTTASADLGSQLNLNAIAIGLGLETIEYEPERFPGVIYRPPEYDQTVVVLFGNGTLFVESAASAAMAEIAAHVAAELDELGLGGQSGLSADVSLSPTEVPVPPEYEPETAATSDAEPAGTAGAGSDGAATTCSNCGHELTGEENFCPECGTEIAAD